MSEEERIRHAALDALTDYPKSLTSTERKIFLIEFCIRETARVCEREADEYDGDGTIGEQLAQLGDSFKTSADIAEAIRSKFPAAFEATP